MGFLSECMEGATAMLRGHRGRRSMVVQSIEFSKRDFTLVQAKAWLKREGFKYGKVDETPHEYRFRQEDPFEFTVFRSKTLARGVRATVAR